jgi:hypothetical protein
MTQLSTKTYAKLVIARLRFEKLSIWMLVFCVVFSVNVNAQSKRVIMQGTVLDANNNSPVSYAGIINKITQTGSVADRSGRFQLLTYTGATLTFSAIGFKNTNVELPYMTENDTIDFEVLLFKDTLTIKEISIIAYPNRAQFGTVFTNKKIEKDFIQKTQESIIEALKHTPPPLLQKSQYENRGGLKIISINPTDVLIRIIENRKNNRFRTKGYKDFFDSMPDSLRINNPHKTLEEIRNEMHK